MRRARRSSGARSECSQAASTVIARELRQVEWIDQRHPRQRRAVAGREHRVAGADRQQQHEATAAAIHAIRRSGPPLASRSRCGRHCTSAATSNHGNPTSAIRQPSPSPARVPSSCRPRLSASDHGHQPGRMREREFARRRGRAGSAARASRARRYTSHADGTEVQRTAARATRPATSASGSAAASAATVVQASARAGFAAMHFGGEPAGHRDERQQRYRRARPAPRSDRSRSAPLPTHHASPHR